MVSQLIVGVNTHVTLAEASAYLEDSLRGTPWLSVDPDSQARALISAYRLFEKQSWQGTATGVKIVDSVVITSGGSSYVVDDILTFIGGTFGQATRVQVTTVASGVITALKIIDAGTYDSTDLATSPNSATGGTGTGASLTPTFVDQTSLQPRTGLTDCDGQTVDVNTVAQSIEEGQIELAFDLSQDDTLEEKKNQGSNVKSVGAGSAKVDFFRASNKPGESQRFPPIVQELIRCFLGGTSTTNGAAGFGTDHCSQFDDADRYDIRSGGGFP